MVSNIFSDLGSFILWMLVFFVWIGAIFALFYVITDLFRDRSIGTGSKVALVHRADPGAVARGADLPDRPR